jgi:hypothetical protein
LLIEPALCANFRCCADRYEGSVEHVREERLTIKRTATGYWVVARGSVHLAGALTREAAEAERQLLERLHNRGRRRGHRLPQRVRS